VNKPSTQDPRAASLAHSYYDLKQWIWSSTYAGELEWQHSTTMRNLSPERILREYAWVIINSGFREATARRVFPSISHAFLNWHPSAIYERQDVVAESALQTFGNRKKIHSILEGCLLVHNRGVSWIEEALEQNSFSTLCELPYVGPITCRHLAKNLGANCCKHDRHLMRQAEVLGFGNPDDLCQTIAWETGDPVQVVDYVLWRGAAAGQTAGWAGTRSCALQVR